MFCEEQGDDIDFEFPEDYAVGRRVSTTIPAPPPEFDFLDLDAEELTA